MISTKSYKIGGNNIWNLYTDIVQLNLIYKHVYRVRKFEQQYG